jgi:hypothetical protein
MALNPRFAGQRLAAGITGKKTLHTLELCNDHLHLFIRRVTDNMNNRSRLRLPGRYRWEAEKAPIDHGVVLQEDVRYCVRWRLSHHAIEISRQTSNHFQTTGLRLTSPVTCAGVNIAIDTTVAPVVNTGARSWSRRSPDEW